MSLSESLKKFIVLVRKRDATTTALSWPPAWIVSLVSVLIALAAATQQALADVAFVDGDVNSENIADAPRIEITGTITDSDRQLFLEALPTAFRRSKFRDVIVVRLNSPGGDILTAMWMGRGLRKLNAFTVVSRGDQCSSACVLILSAGTSRFTYGARVGLHRVYFEPHYFARLNREQAQARYRVLENSVSAYLKEMGMPDALYEHMRKVPSNQIRYLTEAELDQLTLSGNDPASDEYDRARRRREMGEERFQRLEAMTACMNAGGSMESCKRKYFPNE